MSKENQKLIKQLATAVQPFESREDKRAFLLKWLAFSTLFLGSCLYVIPWRDNAMEQLLDPHFEFINLLWLSLGISSAVTFYYSSFPQSYSKTIKVIPMAILGLLLLVSLPGIQHDQLHVELEFWRGGCGILIMIYTMIQGSFMFAWAQKGAPRSPSMTGLWAALSCSALGCLLMQMICLQENPLHIMLWHFLPLMTLLIVGWILARFSLRW